MFYVWFVGNTLHHQWSLKQDNLFDEKFSYLGIRWYFLHIILTRLVSFLHLILSRASSLGWEEFRVSIHELKIIFMLILMHMNKLQHRLLPSFALHCIPLLVKFKLVQKLRKSSKSSNNLRWKVVIPVFPKGSSNGYKLLTEPLWKLKWCLHILVEEFQLRQLFLPSLPKSCECRSWILRCLI